MKLSHPLFALFAPLCVLRAQAAADSGGAAEPPFAELRKDLNELKAPPSPVTLRPGLDLGAAGIDVGARFSAPPPALPAPVRTDPGVAPQKPASSGWLLDALEENSRRTGVGTVPPAAGRDENAAAEERPAKGRGSSIDDGHRDASSLERNPTSKSPLSAYLAAWLSPEDFRRLQSLYPDLAAAPVGKDVNSGNAIVPGRAAPSAEAGDPQSGLGSFGELNLRPNNPNPYLAGVPALTRPAATTAIQLEQPKLAPPVAAVPRAAEPAPVRTATPAVPPAPGADDRKYFPQLKRF
jgi:hypothetical protein